jgi:hypothetical protein
MKKIFLEELSKTPVMSAVCNKLNLSRETIYRWQREDFEFKHEYELVYKYGTNNVNDLAKSKIISKINDGDFHATKFWLESRDPEFAKPRIYYLKQAEQKEEKVDKITVRIVKTKEDLED